MTVTFSWAISRNQDCSVIKNKFETIFSTKESFLGGWISGRVSAFLSALVVPQALGVRQESFLLLYLLDCFLSFLSQQTVPICSPTTSPSAKTNLPLFLEDVSPWLPVMVSNTTLVMTVGDFRIHLVYFPKPLKFQFL